MALEYYIYYDTISEDTYKRGPDMNSTNRKLFVLNVILNLLDYTTTYFAVTKLGATEINPIIRPMVERGKWRHLFAVKLAGIGLTYGLAKILSRSRPGVDGQKNAKRYLLITNTVTGIVVLSNSIQICIKILLNRREMAHN